MTGTFEKLNHINVNDKTKEKGKLKYLSWVWAWAETKKACPDATYTVDDYDGRPYLYDPNLGYMVSTVVTIGGESIPMHLPVLDGANKSQKSEDYTYDTKYKKGLIVEAATMFDINTAIMRCLTKNLAMFGLGLYIYAGEDIPEVSKDDPDVANILSMLNPYNQALIAGNWDRLIVPNWNKLSVQIQNKLQGK